MGDKQQRPYVTLGTSVFSFPSSDSVLALSCVGGCKDSVPCLSAMVSPERALHVFWQVVHTWRKV